MVNDYYNILPSKETLNSLIEFAKMQLIMMQKSHRYMGGQKSHRYVGGQIIVCPPVGDEPTAPIKFCNNVKFHNDNNSCYIDSLLSIIVNYNCADNRWFDNIITNNDIVVKSVFEEIKPYFEEIKKKFVQDNKTGTTMTIRDNIRASMRTIAKIKGLQQLLADLNIKGPGESSGAYNALINTKDNSFDIYAVNDLYDVMTKGFCRSKYSTYKFAVLSFSFAPFNPQIINIDYPITDYDMIPEGRIVGCTCNASLAHYVAIFKKNKNPEDHTYYYDNDMSNEFEIVQCKTNEDLLLFIQNKRIYPELVFYEKL
jgi:hypothetical protein